MDNKPISGTGGDLNSKGVKARSGAAQELRSLFEDELNDILGAEKALTKAIPKLIDNTSSSKLIALLTDHLNSTIQQVARLEVVFKSIGSEAASKKCEAMEGLVREAEEIMKSTVKGAVRDAAIIAASQKVEHYEIASYGTLRAFASILEEDEAASLLEETLAEEKEANDLLTQIAQSAINIEAL